MGRIGKEVSLRHAVFLDRDGVLSRSLLRDGKPLAPTTVEEFELLPGVADALNNLHAAGFLLVVVTNQPDVSTGVTRREAVEEMHRRLREWLPVDEIKVCYHVEADGCDCRKPKPGMLLAAAHERGIDLKSSWMVGDRWRDVAAGKSAGCRTILVECHYAERKAEAPDFAVQSLPEAAEIILKEAAERVACGSQHEIAGQTEG
jgi:D-glycero-D-manno-heptose 1,7-bisphosphate phosphatase